MVRREPFRVVVFLLAALLCDVGCGPLLPEPEVANTQVVMEGEADSVSAEEAVARRAIHALGEIRRSAPDLAQWRPQNVARLGATLAILDSSHAFVWRDDSWEHVPLPGPAPFRVPSLQRPQVHARGDGQRVVFAGPSTIETNAAGASESGADGIGLYELTAEGLHQVGVLPDWVAACRAFVMSGDHLYVSVSDEARERETTLLHAVRGADADDWRSLSFSMTSNTPDLDMQMGSEGALLLSHGDKCDVLRFPAEGPSFEPAPLFSSSRERSCQLHVTQGVTPERIIVSGVSISILENGRLRDVQWPEDCVPFERPGDYEGYEQLSPSERIHREADLAARTSSPGLVGLNPLLFERFHPDGPADGDGQSVSQPMSSAFHLEEGNGWLALPEEAGEQTTLIMAMHFAGLSRPSWSSPIYWGPFRISVAQGRWVNSSPQATLKVWRRDDPELVMEAFSAQ